MTLASGYGTKFEIWIGMVAAIVTERKKHLSFLTKKAFLWSVMASKTTY